MEGDGRSEGGAEKKNSEVEEEEAHALLAGSGAAAPQVPLQAAPSSPDYTTPPAITSLPPPRSGIKRGDRLGVDARTAAAVN